jgi:hypothetical protein
MALEDYLLTEDSFTGNEIEGLDDQPNLTAEELKDKFDAASKNVIAPAINGIINTLLTIMHPVGSILMTTNSANPSTYLGGTWVAWGLGRVPVGVDTGQTEFNTVEKTGGAKTITLTTAQIPAHSHDVPVVWSAGSTVPAQSMCLYESNTKKGTVPTSSEGTGSAHSNLQPYITCYMWKRTA